MRLHHTFCLAVVLPLVGCTTVVQQSYQDIRTSSAGTPVIEVNYSLQDGYIEAGHLVVPVQRSCTQVDTVTATVVQNEVLDPEITRAGWYAIGGAALAALIPGIITLNNAGYGPAESEQEYECNVLAGGVFFDQAACDRTTEELATAQSSRSTGYAILGVGAVLDVVGLAAAFIYDARSGTSRETIVSSSTDELRTPMSVCPSLGDDTAFIRVGPDGPIIEAALFSDNLVAPIGARQDVDWSRVPGFWVRSGDSPDWQSVPNGTQLVAEIRDWGASDPDAEPRRVFVFTDVDDEQLADVLTQRVRAALTSSGRYTVMSDATSRDAVRGILDDSSGAPSERMRSALAEANIAAVDNVIWVTSTEMDAQTDLIDIALYDSLSGDITFSTNTTVENGDAMGLLGAVDRLMDELE